MEIPHQILNWVWGIFTALIGLLYAHNNTRIKRIEEDLDALNKSSVRKEELLKLEDQLERRFDKIDQGLFRLEDKLDKYREN